MNELKQQDDFVRQHFEKLQLNYFNYKVFPDIITQERLLQLDIILPKDVVLNYFSNLARKEIVQLTAMDPEAMTSWISEKLTELSFSSRKTDLKDNDLNTEELYSTKID